MFRARKNPNLFVGSPKFLRKPKVLAEFLNNKGLRSWIWGSLALGVLHFPKSNTKSGPLGGRVSAEFRKFPNGHKMVPNGPPRPWGPPRGPKKAPPKIGGPLGPSPWGKICCCPLGALGGAMYNSRSTPFGGLYVTSRSTIYHLWPTLGGPGGPCITPDHLPWGARGQVG